MILIAVALTTLAARLFGPGDLYDKDQPKTMAASADVALNNHWTWPRDMLLEPSTKPPMYNWLDALLLKLAPGWDEWTFKLPSIAATFIIAWLIVVMTRHLLRDHEHAETIAYLAAAIWFANVPVMKQMYLSRPDMVMTVFLTGAWVCSTRAIIGKRKTTLRRRRGAEQGTCCPDSNNLPSARCGLASAAMETAPQSELDLGRATPASHRRWVGTPRISTRT
jgi:4-amino-4-deoxy-L-arabinose transferase-like glycosyltransferase